MACVDIRALPLQLLLRKHPEWRARPVVVVDRDKPQGLILHANEPAHARRIFPGMRFATALGLSSELRGGVVDEQEVREAVALLTRRLWSFSPRIEGASARETEACVWQPGLFWLDASGLRHVYPSLERWAHSICADLRELGFEAVVAVGFSRFGAYAAARSSARTLVFDTPEQERAHLYDAPIEHLNFTPHLRDSLLKLGVETLGRFIELPPTGIRRRFGAEAAAFHAFARGDGWLPLNPERLLDPIECRHSLDYSEDRVDRLLIIIASLLHPMLTELHARHERLKALRFTLALDNHAQHDETIAPATPTLDANQILSLVRLRLEALSMKSPVAELRLHATGVSATQRQLSLLHDAPQQQLDAAQAAFAKLRAQFGNNAVVRARLYDGHLPEAQFGWESIDRVDLPRPQTLPLRPLVRRIYTPPLELPPRDRQEPDGWLIAGIADGPVEEVIGPHIVSGDWWDREITRAYHYVRTRSGRWLWIYHDREQRKWFLCGETQ